MRSGYDLNLMCLQMSFITTCNICPPCILFSKKTINLTKNNIVFIFFLFYNFHLRFTTQDEVNDEVSFCRHPQQNPHTMHFQLCILILNTLTYFLCLCLHLYVTFFLQHCIITYWMHFYHFFNFDLMTKLGKISIRDHFVLSLVFCSYVTI